MRKLILIFSAVGLIVCGCVTMEHTVAVNNMSSQMVTEFNLKAASGKFDVRYGNLAPKTSPPGASFRSEWRIKPSDTCIATWLDASGQKHEVKIDLSKQVGLGFHPDLQFTLNQDGTISVEKLK